MGIGIFFAVVIFFSIIGFLKSLRKERKRRELAESVLKPLLEKTFGTYDHYADRCLPRQEVEGLVRGDPHGHDLVEVMYKDSKVRFCSMHFTEDDRDEDGHTQTYEVYRGQCVVIEKENFINNPVLVAPKRAGRVHRKERVLTDDPEFDSLIAAAGDPVEVLKILSPTAREKLAGLVHRHVNLVMLFESNRIRVSYGVKDYFEPRFGTDTAQLYERQLNDLLDIINTLIDL